MIRCAELVEYIKRNHVNWNTDSTLLSVLPRETRLLKSATDDIYYHCDCPKGNVDMWFDNPVDACVKMIEYYENRTIKATTQRMC